MHSLMFWVGTRWCSVWTVSLDTCLGFQCLHSYEPLLVWFVSLLGHLGGFLRGLLCTVGRAVLIRGHEPMWHGRKCWSWYSLPLHRAKYRLFMNTVVLSSAWGLWSPSSPFCHSNFSSFSLVSDSACIFFVPTPRACRRFISSSTVTWNSLKAEFLKMSIDGQLFAAKVVDGVW